LGERCHIADIAVNKPGFRDQTAEPDLYPEIVLRCPLAALMAGVQSALWFDQHHPNFLLGERLVLHTLWNDEHLAGSDMDGAIAKIDPQLPFENDESFIRFRMIVPDEIPFDADEFELVVVHLSDDSGLPEPLNLSKLLLEIDSLPGRCRACFTHDLPFRIQEG
jgi:hypothetical protein